VVRVLGRLSRLRAWHEKKNTIRITTVDGEVHRFPKSALGDAFLRNLDNIRRACDDKEPLAEHPLSSACRNSTDVGLRESVYVLSMDDLKPVPDLSEEAE
jgi:hypothetical protein